MNWSSLVAILWLMMACKPAEPAQVARPPVERTQPPKDAAVPSTDVVALEAIDLKALRVRLGKTIETEDDRGALVVAEQLVSAHRVQGKTRDYAYADALAIYGRLLKGSERWQETEKVFSEALTLRVAETSAELRVELQYELSAAYAHLGRKADAIRILGEVLTTVEDLDGKGSERALRVAEELAALRDGTPK